MNPETLLKAQLRLECIGINANGRMHRIAGANPDDIHRFFIAKHHHGFTALVRDDVPEHTAQQFLALSPDCAFIDAAAVGAILYAKTELPTEGWRGRAYYFTEQTFSWRRELVRASQGR